MCMSDKEGDLFPKVESEGDNASSPDNENSEAQLLPNQFKTVSGKMVNLIGTQNSSKLALISYSTSKIQGNVLLTNAVENPVALVSEANSMFDGGVLDDEEGNEINSLILPVDAFDLSPMLRGVIVDSDLRGYENGFTCLLGSCEDRPLTSGNLSNALCAMKSFVKTLGHLATKGYCWREIDGHQFYFNVQYGLFRLVYDGVGVDKKSENDSPEQMEQLSRGVSSIIMFLLTGAWPDSAEGGVVKHLDSDVKSMSWDFEANRPCGEVEKLNKWNSLPEAMRNALFKSCFATPRDDISLEEWEQILQQMIDDVDKCVFCGHEMFKTAIRCLCCGKTTKKDDLLAKWAIRTANRHGEFRISFGRGVTVPGEIFGISSGFMPYMKLMYSPNSNLLGVKNVSNTTWRVTRPEETIELPPESIVPITTGMSVEFKDYPDVCMQFLGYES